jgi:hypothetical protein
MIITGTSDDIELVLGANVATNQLHINASYAIVSSTSITPARVATTSNNTTAVNIVPSPSSGNQHQLKYCNIFNSDSVPATVTIRTNYNGTTRIALSTVLHVNDYIQYTQKTGWKVFNMSGQLRNRDSFNTLADVRAQEFYLNTNVTTTATTLTSGNTYCGYLGRATGPYTEITVNNVTTTAITATVSWAELAIYKGTPSLGAGTTLTRLGFVDISQALTQAGQNRWFIVPVTGVVPGDDLWCVYGILTSGTSPALRAAAIADTIGAGFVQTAGNNRPSTTLTLTGTLSTTNTFPSTYWNAI